MEQIPHCGMCRSGAGKRASDSVRVTFGASGKGKRAFGDRRLLGACSGTHGEVDEAWSGDCTDAGGQVERRGIVVDAWSGEVENAKGGGEFDDGVGVRGDDDGIADCVAENAVKDGPVGRVEGSRGEERRKDDDRR